jgi:hypothetical protein
VRAGSTVVGSRSARPPGPFFEYTSDKIEEPLYLHAAGRGSTDDISMRLTEKPRPTSSFIPVLERVLDPFLAVVVSIPPARRATNIARNEVVRADQGHVNRLISSDRRGESPGDLALLNVVLVDPSRSIFLHVFKDHRRASLVALTSAERGGLCDACLSTPFSSFDDRLARTGHGYLPESTDGPAIARICHLAAFTARSGREPTL